MTDLNHNPRKWWRQLAAMLLAGSAIASSTCGCVHRDLHAGRNAETTLPRLTALMSGPLANLLTNQSSFEAECLITLAGAAETPRTLSGRIFAHQGKLRLELAAGKAKAGGAGEFGVIWDATANQGYILSDALQGYATLKGSARFTNRLTGTGTGQPDRLEGHPVDHADMTAMGSDGQKIALQLTRAEDLGNLPLQIRSADEPNSFSLTLTQVRLLQPAEALFLPPGDFTKYANETALLDELIARQQTVFGGGHERARAPGEADVPDIHHRADSNGP